MHDGSENIKLAHQIFKANKTLLNFFKKAARA
jgi:hypothetical protein